MDERCELCRGLRGHMRIKDAMCDEFKREYENAKQELHRLTTLFRECCWYNFETSCRSWRTPWYMSWGPSDICLHGLSHKKCGAAEQCTFPIWYSGPLDGAPALPPSIIHNEIKHAKAYMHFMREQITAPHDYAPGGRAYEKLLREGQGVKEYDRLSSKRKLKEYGAT